MVNPRNPDFLDDSIPGAMQGNVGANLDFLADQNLVVAKLDAILEELQKGNPSVLASIVMQGVNPLPAAPAQQAGGRRITFSVGGMAVTAYKVWLWSTYSGVARIGLAGMANLKDGFTLSATPILIHAPTSELYLMTDGTAVCPVNQPADATAGGVWILPYTIPVFAQRIEREPLFDPTTVGLEEPN